MIGPWLDTQRGARPCHYVIVRRDLPSGTAMAMAVHAAGESGPADSLTTAVVLQVASEHELLAAWPLALRVPGARAVLIREPDAPWHGQAMAIGLLSPQGKLKAFQHLRLWRPT